MNMKKTLAGLMAGIVAISAMATVAVSAKAQKAEEVTWSTMNKEKKNAETIVYVVVPQGDLTTYWLKDTTGIQLQWATAPATPAGLTVNDLEIVEVTKITNRKAGNATVETEDLARLYDVVAVGATTAAQRKNTIVFRTTPIDAGAEVELAIKVKAPAGVNIGKNSIVARYANTFTALAADAKGNWSATGLTQVAANTAAPTATNVKKDASDKKVGVLLNHTAAWVTDNGDDDDNNDGTKETAVGNAEIERKDTVYVRDLDTAISTHMKNDANVLEPVAEIADTLKDAKGATIAFNFEKSDIDESVSDKEFAEWVNRYDWNADAMKSAISLRINNSNVLSVDMMEFDKTNFSAVYSWDEVMSKFQVGSVTGLVNTMGLKINNEKLPAKKDKDKEVIDLRLASITVKIPEMADTKDDTMVEDFAAGESATVVEDTLPATTDAPAATDATTAATEGAANPETGNSAIALLAIPAALAAAAIVAKKRG